MPRLRSETLGAGDQSWLGSDHGIWNCRTETVDVSAFTAGTHYPNGYLRSGQPLAKVSGLMVPYNAAGTGGTERLAGFLFTDQAVVSAADFAAPVLDHGRVKVGKIAGFAKPPAANDDTTVVYI